VATTRDPATGDGSAVDSPGARRLGVVLSAGGLRGVAHLGVLRQLLAHGVPIDVIVGVSAGAIIAGFYAGVGLGIEDMIGDAPAFKGRHVLMHGLVLRAPGMFKPFLRRFSGVIPNRLRQLDEARFDRLHHGVRGLGIVCHDMLSNQTMYFTSSEQCDVPLSAAVKGSAAVPGLIPTRAVQHGGRRVQLVDGGLSDSLPWQFARTRLGATHLIVSDCRRVADATIAGPSIVYVRPELRDQAILRSPAGTLVETVALGEAACTREVIDAVRAWGFRSTPGRGLRASSASEPIVTRPSNRMLSEPAT